MAIVRAKNLTAKQVERQHDMHRDKGAYAATNPCELCAKSCGVEYYSSDHHGRGELGAAGLVLHKACAQKIDAMSVDEARKALRLAPKPKPKAQAAPPPPRPTSPRLAELDRELAELHRVVMTTDDSYAAKMKIMTLRSERNALWKQLTNGIDPKYLRMWAKEDRRGW